VLERLGEDSTRTSSCGFSEVRRRGNRERREVPPDWLEMVGRPRPRGVEKGVLSGVVGSRSQAYSTRLEMPSRSGSSFSPTVPLTNQKEGSKCSAIHCQKVPMAK